MRLVQNFSNNSTRHLKFTFVTLGGAYTSRALLSQHMLDPMSGTFQPQTFYFEDGGNIPNSALPLLLYRNVFSERGDTGATWLEQRFATHQWTNAWRNGIYSFHHYHSTSHEVIGVYQGEALLQLGGEQGQQVAVRAGDILVIPAGVGHKNLGSTNLGVVGAYPGGRSWDLNRGEEGERPRVDRNIAALPLPETDPWQGHRGLVDIWHR